MGNLKAVRLAVAAATLVGGLASASIVAAPAPASADTAPLFVDWTSLLPSLDDGFDPNSANDCTAGRPNCVDITIREMQRRFDPLARSCSHQAVFSMAYLRTTQTYEWARNQLGFFADTPWVNHEDAVFAKYYFQAYDNWAAGQRAAVPQAWLIALDAAANRRVSGSGNLLLGMSAHVNRDLPFVLAAIGITAPDGSTRKPDHDKVNQFLNAELQQLLAEEGARFDPATYPNINTPYGIGYTGLFQTLAVWREQAWRNAEALTDAPTAADRAIVAQQIEASAAAEAQSLVVADAYVPPLTNSSGRDAYCAVHYWDAAPLAYPWGTPTPG
jgi:hypothetical protein